MALEEKFKGWSLFLDRDGVINRRIPGDYVKRIEEFNFNPGAAEAIAVFSKIFRYIFVVTNQQGIGKGLMDEYDLAIIHDYMLEKLRQTGGRIDKVYFCPGLAKDNPACRKPQIGMALQAKADFPDVDFSRSLMIGDSVSDIEFGNNAGMTTYYISHNGEIPDSLPNATPVFRSLAEIAGLPE